MPRMLGLAVLATSLLTATPGAAQLTLSPPQLKCQKFVGAQASRLARLAHTTARRCRDQGRAADCNDAKITRVAAKLPGRLAKQCGGVLEALGFPGLCPDPGGAPFTTAELATCLIDSHRAAMDSAIATEYPGASQLVSSAPERCRRRIGRAAERFLGFTVKHRQRCLNGQLRGRLPQTWDCRASVPPAGQGTGDAKLDRKLAKTNAQLTQQLVKGCTNVTLEGLGFPGSCPDPNGVPFTLDELDACMQDLLGPTTALLLDTEYPDGAVTPTPTATVTPVTDFCGDTFPLCNGSCAGGGCAELGGGCVCVSSTASPTATITPPPSPTPTSTGPTPTPTVTPIATPLPSVEDLTGIITPGGDADGDGFSNALELAACSNPADPASTPENDDTFCANSTIFSDSFGPAWGNTNRMADPTYNAATGALVAQNAADCAVYCSTTSNINQPQSCLGAWPWSGAPEHGTYEAGETVEANFLDQSGLRLSATIFLPPRVTCMPATQPVCDGVTDAVVCTDPLGATYPAVIITEGFTGTQRMYFWAAHRLAEHGYITMTFDVSGQGRSQGSFPNGDASVAADTGECGFSRDAGAAINWFVGVDNPVRNLVEESPLLIANQATGASDHLETYNLGTAGHSAGACGSIAYQQSTEALYPVRTRAVVGWSHFDAAGTIGNVPIQLHSGDEDSGFIQPPGAANQMPAMERRFDRLAGDRNLDGTADFTPSDRQIIAIEDATHLGYSQLSWAYYPTWQEEVQYHYTLAWFDKYLGGNVSRTMSGVVGNEIQSVDPFNDYAVCSSGATCFAATARLTMSHTHLSNTWCSRYDIDGSLNADMKGGGCQTQ